MQHKIEQNQSGIWSWWTAEGATVGGHAERAGGPLTVFWAGDVSAPRLRHFMEQAADLVAGGPGLARSFSTILMTDDDEVRLTSHSAPPYPPEVPAAGFVRFECGPENSQQLVAWAHLDHPPPDQVDAIGVYCAPDDLKQLTRAIAGLVCETTYAHLRTDVAIKVLEDLRTDLGEGAAVGAPRGGGGRWRGASG